MTNDNMTTEGGRKPPQRFLDEAEAMEKSGPLNSVFIHTKSGQPYIITGYCWIEESAEPAILYSKEGSDTPEPIWARPASEFFNKFKPRAAQ